MQPILICQVIEENPIQLKIIEKVLSDQRADCFIMTRKTSPNFSLRSYTVRLISEEDSASIVSFYVENKEHLAAWDPKAPEDFYTEEYWKEKASLWRHEFHEDKSCRLHLFTDSGRMLGSANFTTIERGPFQNVRVGYKIGKEWEGQGIMYEFMKAGISYVFDELSLHRVEANYIPENIRSGNLLERLGFVKHGVAPNYLKINGEWRDHILSSKLNPTYEQ